MRQSESSSSHVVETLAKQSLGGRSRVQHISAEDVEALKRIARACDRPMIWVIRRALAEFAERARKEPHG